MRYNKPMKKLAFAIAVVSVAASICPLPTFAISEELKGSISTNCSSIKFRLEKVQKDDSRNRVHLGAQYESIATNLMMNLNLRLVKNNLANAKLAEQQTTFISERNRFKNDFIGYSQELDALIDMDCRNEPEKFYEQLQLVRTKRADVEKSIKRMDEILTKHRESILDFRKGLKK